uniref:Secreted protein n=1 Tax=Ascaris lumbricoides TaxID=6252 RepID=A0A0M3HS94_ASCLU
MNAASRLEGSEFPSLLSLCAFFRFYFVVRFWASLAAVPSGCLLERPHPRVCSTGAMTTIKGLVCCARLDSG